MILHGSRIFHENNMRIDPQDFVTKIGFKAVHHGQDNNQCGHTQKNTGNGNKCNNGNKDLLPLGP